MTDTTNETLNFILLLVPPKTIYILLYMFTGIATTPSPPPFGAPEEGWDDIQWKLPLLQPTATTSSSTTTGSATITSSNNE